MLKTIKHQTRGFLFGVFVTAMVIGCAHISIRFDHGAAAYELTQTETVATELAKVMPAHLQKAGVK
jgi:hypothetical protein